MFIHTNREEITQLHTDHYRVSTVATSLLVLH